MAQLTDTRPTTYYMHQYSGEEIDAAVGRALTGGALDTSVTNVSNQLGTFVRPNLLDNWYFGNPVNQRGQTSYTGNGYTVDRWKFTTDAGNIAVSNGYLDIFSTRAYGSYLEQKIDPELAKALAGKTVTYSVLAADGDTVFTANMRKSDSYIGGFTIEPNTVSCNTWTFPTDSTDIVCNFVGINAGHVRPIAAKLELGPTQTLAHQENGAWVLNEVPEYGGQLRRCQRYCRVIGGTLNEPICITIRRESTILEGCILFDFPMRTAPSVSITGAFSTIPGFLGIEFTSQDSISPEGCSLFFKQHNGAPFEDTAYLIYAQSDTRITFSADL